MPPTKVKMSPSKTAYFIQRGDQLIALIVVDGWDEEQLALRGLAAGLEFASVLAEGLWRGRVDYDGTNPTTQFWHPLSRNDSGYWQKGEVRHRAPFPIDWDLCDGEPLF
jgi:hypothetical protein